MAKSFGVDSVAQRVELSGPIVAVLLLNHPQHSNMCSACSCRSTVWWGLFRRFRTSVVVEPGGMSSMIGSGFGGDSVSGSHSMEGEKVASATLASCVGPRKRDFGKLEVGRAPRPIGHLPILIKPL